VTGSDTLEPCRAAFDAPLATAQPSESSLQASCVADSEHGALMTYTTVSKFVDAPQVANSAVPDCDGVQA
jgi:hypothetical protein